MEVFTKFGQILLDFIKQNYMYYTDRTKVQRYNEKSL